MTQTSASDFRTLERLVLHASDQGRYCFLFALCWIAQCDGQLHEDESTLLREATRDTLSEQEFRDLLRASAAPATHDVQLALGILRATSSRMALPLLQLAISISLADGYLRTIENHYLRLMTDVLGLGMPGLDYAFREMTGHAFPPAGDPSNPSWWQSRQRSEVPSRREQDLGALGLGIDASLEDIRTAFRRLAKVHHPDRFASAGPAATKAAELQFMRIRAAYERLTAS
jgi:DnaJ-domain-containing protein 1